MPEISAINHVAFTVTDLERSVPWYEELFGLTKVMEGPHPDGAGSLVLLAKPDFSLVLALHVHPANERERFSEARTGLDHVSFGVKNHGEIEAWESRLTELGIEHSPINDQESYSVVVFRDPDNIQLEFICMG